MITYLALGSNLGDRKSYLASAIFDLIRNGVRILRCASIYLTEPRDVIDQPWFLNTAVEADTLLDPEQLLQICLAVERTHSRQRTTAKGPRTLDIDIIFYGSKIVEKPGLAVPHPLFSERRFVLEPLAEIAPEFVDPISGRTVRQLLEALADPAEVRYWGPSLLQ